MKTFRLPAVLLAIVFATPFAFTQESGEIASLRAKAERGNGIAQYNLGLAYAEGRGVTRDPVEAFVWLSLARDNGARGRALDTLLAGLDRDTLAAAQARLSERRNALGIRPAAPASAPAKSAAARTEESTPAAPPAPGGLPTQPAAPESQPASPATPAASTDDAVARLQAERDALAVRLNSLSGDLAELRAERDRLLRFAAEQETAVRNGTEAARTLQSQLRAAEARATELEQQVGQARAALAALQNTPKPAPDAAALEQKDRELRAALDELAAAREFGRKVEDTLNRVNEEKTRTAQAAATELQAARAFGEQVEATLNRVNDEKAALERELRTARESLASRAAAPAWPDLRDRVAELETQLTAATSQPKTPDYPDLRDRVAELETALSAARNAAPAHPDLSNKVAELEQALTAARARADEQSALAQNATPRLRELEARVAALTAEAALRQRETASLAAARAEAERARDAIAKQFEDYKGSTAAALREQANLQASVKLLESDKAALRRQAETAGNEAAQLRTQIASLREQVAAKPSTPSWPDLRARVAELEAGLARANIDLSAEASAKADLRSRVAELETALTAAKNAAPAYPDYTDLVKDLTAEVTKLRAMRDTQQQSLAASAVRMKELETQLAKAGADLSAAVSAKTGLEAALTAAKNAAPAYPDLSGKVAELETQLAEARQPKAPAWPDLRGKVAELEANLTQANAERSALSAETANAKQEIATLAKAKAEADAQVAALTKARDAAKAELQAALANRSEAPAAPAWPDLRRRVAELERDLAVSRHQTQTVRTELAKAQEPSATPIAAGDLPYPDLTGRVRDLEGQLAAAQKQLQAAGAPAPPWPDLRGRVADLEAAVADSARRLVAAENTSAALQRDLAQARAAAQPKMDDTQLRRERDELAGEVAQLRGDRERMQKLLADAGRQMRDSTADAARIKELEAQLARLSTDSTGTQQEVARLTRAVEDAETNAKSLQAALAERTAADNRRAERLAQLETENERLQAAARASGSPAPAYPDLSGRVAELQHALSDSHRQLSEAQARLTRAANSTATTPAWPDLRERVAELEAQVTRLAAAAPADTGAAPAAGNPDLEKRLAETEDKLATALRGYALLQREHDALQGRAASANEAVENEKNALAVRVRELETQLAAATADLSAAGSAKAEKDALTAQVASLTTEVERLRAESAQATAANIAQERDALAARVAEAERAAAAAQAEAARANESLAALRRSTGQSSGELTSTRALVQQLQGANAVLAQENYQLKTMLARNAGGPAPAAATPRVAAPTTPTRAPATPTTVAAAPTLPPGARTHTVATGDSLSRISQRYYGTAGRWQEIYNANADKLGPNGILRIGTELRIP
ncbi:MAG: LysM peptidoglycan-binding domain-containing protein [Verrucomicrobiota bacterium]